MKQKRYSHLIDYLIELNIVFLILAFPLIHVGLDTWFNNLWQSLLVIWIVNKFIIKTEFKIIIPPAGSFLVIFLGAVMLSTLLSEQVETSLKNIKYFILGTGLYILSHDFFRQDEKKLWRVVNYFIVSALAVSLDAIIQAFFTRDIFGSPMAGMRASGFFSHPFYLALWSGSGIFLAIFNVTRASNKVEGFIYYACLLIMGIAFALSQTRAAWIAMGVGLLVTFLYFPYRKLSRIAFIIAAIILAFIILDDSFRMRMLSIFQAGDPRWSLWNQYLVMVKERFYSLDWFFGRGPGLFKLEYAQYDMPKSLHLTFPHMIIFELFYSTGLLGSSAFLIWLVYYIYKAFVKERRSNNLTLFFICFMPLLILLTCLINESFYSRYFSFPFWFFSGISSAVLYRKEKAESLS